ncbi:MAG: hypothetical protein ACK4P3_01820 [Fimbriimonadaceae bacterium]
MLRQLAFAKSRGASGVNCLGPLGESQAMAHWQLREVVQSVCRNPFGLPVAVFVDQVSIELARWMVRLASSEGAALVRWSPPLGKSVDQETLGPWIEAVGQEAEGVGIRLETTLTYVTERNRFAEWINGAFANLASGDLESAAEKWKWIQAQVEATGEIATAKDLKTFLFGKGVIDSTETRFPYT